MTNGLRMEYELEFLYSKSSIIGVRASITRECSEESAPDSYLVTFGFVPQLSCYAGQPNRTEHIARFVDLLG